MTSTKGGDDSELGDTVHASNMSGSSGAPHGGDDSRSYSWDNDVEAPHSTLLSTLVEDETPEPKKATVVSCIRENDANESTRIRSPPPAQQHKRNISWGQNEVFPTFPLPMMEDEPIVRQSSDQSGAAAPKKNHQQQQQQRPPRDRGYSDASELTMDQILLRSDSAKRRLARLASSSNDEHHQLLTLDDVRMAHPREDEAVTCILRALEEIEPSTAPRSSSRATSTTSSDAASTVVFPNLPDEVVNIVGVGGSVDDMAISETSSFGTVSEPTTTPRSPRRYQQSPTNTTKATRRISIKGLHRRTGTMEQQLFGLTAAIDALQQEKWNHHPLEEKWGEAPDEILPVGSAADALQKNASILYNRSTTTTRRKSRRKNETESHMSEPASSISSATGGDSNTARTKWKKVREAVRTGNGLSAEAASAAQDSKKSDDRDGNSIDEELGSISDDHDGNQNEIGNVHAESNQPTQANNTKSTKDQNVLFREFSDYLKPQMKSLRKFTIAFVLLVVLPLVSLAAILFYVAGNPSGGILINNGKPVNGSLINTDGEVVSEDQASVSWCLLFVLRQLLTGVSAKATELFFIDFLSIRSQGLVNLLGPWLTLFIMQSRGWPFVAFTWAIFDLLLLAGSRPFYSHWLYYQQTIQLFNESNPSGNVLQSEWNYRILIIVAVVSTVVSIKRMWLGLYLGRQTFVQYSGKLTSVMRKTLLIAEVSALARKLQKFSTNIKSKEFLPPVLSGPGAIELEALMNSVPEDSSAGGGLPSANRSTKSDIESEDFVVNSDDRNPLTGALSAQQHARITQLLGAWEEPRHIDKVKQEGISINSILQFRRALACLDTPFVFSNAFGLANTREGCVESAQKVFQRLSACSGGAKTLSFQLLALLGVEQGGGLDQIKLKELIRLFRPERDGSLDMLAFVKSIDQVYREIRLLRASLANASKIDRAFENIINTVFYVVVFTVVLASLGLNPLAIFLSISGVVLAFAFMISSASSKYFEGLLFILVRRPYQIGDAIHVSNVEAETSYHGSAWWTVEDVNLFTTKVVFLFTMERASLSNGSLANSRIINSSESTEAYVWTTLKFPIDVTFEKLQIFQRALEEFVKNRPREFLSYVDFRVTQVDVDQGSMSYVVGAQHRSTWAEWTTIMLSKADLILFSVELQKKLGIHYKTPPLPVDLSADGLQAVQRAAQQQRMGSSPTDFVTDNVGDTPAFPDISELQALFPPRSPR